MGTSGYFAYRYKKKYYRQYSYSDAYPEKPGIGQHLVDTIPRDPVAFKDWIAERIRTLGTVKKFSRHHPEGDPICSRPNSDGADELGYTVTYNNGWTFKGELWCYVIDLDNMAFTVNGIDHFRLDNLPHTLSDYYNHDGRFGRDIPEEYLCDSDAIDIWPPPRFDTKECLTKYEALEPTVVPAAKWGVPTWPQLSVSQQFAIKTTHHLLNIYTLFVYSYAADERAVQEFCWDALCASVPALPIFQLDLWNLPARTLVSGISERTWPAYLGVCRSRRDYNWTDRNDMSRDIYFSRPYYEYPSKNSYRDYFRIRGYTVTFCIQLVESVYVAHEVEGMVERIREDGSTKGTGIILSSQKQLLVVSVDETEVQHSPVLDLCVTDGKPSDGLLLLTHLFSPVASDFQTPVRAPGSALKSIVDLPYEVVRMIIDYTDVATYLKLCRVSKFIRSICVANPRVKNYIILHEIPGLEMVFAARDTNDNTVKTIELYWQMVRFVYADHGRWEVWEVSPEDLEELKQKNVH